MIKIEIKDSVNIIENRNKIHYFVSGIFINNVINNFIVGYMLSKIPRVSVFWYTLYHIWSVLCYFSLGLKCSFEVALMSICILRHPWF